MTLSAYQPPEPAPEPARPNRHQRRAARVMARTAKKAATRALRDAKPDNAHLSHDTVETLLTGAALESVLADAAPAPPAPNLGPLQFEDLNGVVMALAEKIRAAQK